MPWYIFGVKLTRKLDAKLSRGVKVQRLSESIDKALAMLILRHHDHGCEIDNQQYEKQLNPTCGCGLDDIISEIKKARAAIPQPDDETTKKTFASDMAKMILSNGPKAPNRHKGNV